jgi:hypothetical protein
MEDKQAGVGFDEPDPGDSLRHTAGYPYAEMGRATDPGIGEFSKSAARDPPLNWVSKGAQSGVQARAGSSRFEPVRDRTPDFRL